MLHIQIERPTTSTAKLDRHWITTTETVAGMSIPNHR
jgi:hypothetical protein